MEHKFDFARIRAEVTMDMLFAHYGLELSPARRAKCPIPSHKGKNISQFSAAPDKFQCFACGAKGGALKFVELMQEVGAVDAAKMVYDWFGMDNGKPIVPVPVVKVEKPTDNEPLKFALQNVNPDHPYLQERGFGKELCAEFGVGFYCSKQKTAYFDNRIVFPLHSPAGELIGYQGRTVLEVTEKNDRWKLPVGLVKNFLYGAVQAKDCASVVVVESPWGVLRLAKDGIPAVATLGKDPTDAQVALLGEYKHLTLMFDGDEAGHKATRRLLPRLANLPFESLKVVMLPDGLQPDQIEDLTEYL